MENMKLDEMREDSDWREVWKYASPASNPITREVIPSITMDDVEEIIAASNGERDEDHWIGVFRLKDGKWVFLSAGCDTTGWDCQAGGSAEWCATLEELKACIGDWDRNRLFPEK